MLIIIEERVAEIKGKVIKKLAINHSVIEKEEDEKQLKKVALDDEELSEWQQ